MCTENRKNERKIHNNDHRRRKISSYCKGNKVKSTNWFDIRWTALMWSLGRLGLHIGVDGSWY